MRPPLWVAAIGALLCVGSWGSLAALLTRTLYTPELASVPAPEYALPASVLLALGLSAAAGLAAVAAHRATRGLQGHTLAQPRVRTSEPCPLCGSRGEL